MPSLLKIYPTWEELRSLVKSLNRGAVKRFKLKCRATRGISNPSYNEQLFDYFIENEKLNIEELEIKFVGTSISNDPSSARCYLLESCLDALCGEKEEGNEHYSSLVGQAKAVLNLGIHSLVPKLISPAEEYSHATNNFGLLLKIIEFRRYELRLSQNFVKANTEFVKLHELENDYAEKAANIREWEKLLDHTFRIEALSNEERLELLDRIINDPIYTDVNSCLSDKAQFLKLFTVSRMERLTGSSQKAREKYLGLILFLEKHEGLLFDDSIYFFYLSFIYFQYHEKIKSGENNAISEGILKFDETRKIRSDLELIVFGGKAKLMAVHALFSLDFESGKRAEEFFSNGLKELGDRIHILDRINISYLLSSYFTFIGDFSNAHKYVYPIRESSDNEMKPDLYFHSWTHFILLKFELNHFDILPDLIRATTRKLKKFNRYSEYEKMLYLCIHKVMNVNTSEQKKGVFEKFRSKMLKLESSPEFQLRLGYFPLFEWFDSHIENRPLREIILERKALG